MTMKILIIYNINILVGRSFVPFFPSLEYIVLRLIKKEIIYFLNMQ